MASVKANHHGQNGNAEISCAKENEEFPSCASLTNQYTENDNCENAVCLGLSGSHGNANVVNPVHNVHCYIGPWAYPWMPPPVLAVPAFCSPFNRLPLLPSSTWESMTSWVNGAWNVPWVGYNGGIFPSSSINNSEISGNGSSTLGSSTLGKHSREERLEKSLWIAETLRIDDPDETAKSSIWATLGINHGEDVKKGIIFKVFKSKIDIKGDDADAAQVLQANPAGFSRSQKFQEST